MHAADSDYGLPESEKAVDGWLKGLNKGRQRKPPAVVNISAGADAAKAGGDNGSSCGKSEKAEPKAAPEKKPPPSPKPAKPKDPGYLSWSKTWHCGSSAEVMRNSGGGNAEQLLR